MPRSTRSTASSTSSSRRAPSPPPTRRGSPASSSTAGWRGCTSRSASAGSACRRSSSRPSTTGCSRPGRRTRSSATPWATACAARRSSSGGRPEQKQKYLRRIFTAEDIWCQLFSEPGAGSDVAGLATMAVRDGDVWMLNGQKVWTSLGHRARWGLIICRTDPEAVKHAGITAFVVDMHAPGVEVRPLRQMTGGAEFNEVYFTDVRVPGDEILGRPGEGWRVSITTLMNERTAIGGATPPRGSGPIASAVELWQALPEAQRVPGGARPADEGVDRGRGDPSQQHARVGQPQAGRAGTGGLGRQARRRPRATRRCTRCAWTCSAPRACCRVATTSPTRRGRPTGKHADHPCVPAQPGQLDRGRHIRGAAQHPRRARAGVARRRARRPRAALEPGAARVARRASGAGATAAT